MNIFQNHFVAAIIYVRFSKLAQKVGSTIERQLADCQGFCDRMGWAVDSVRIDEGRSGYTAEHREADGKLGIFEAEALDGIHAGKVLVCERLDRLSRQQPEEGFDLIRSLSRCDVSVATVDGCTVYQAGKPLPFEQIMMAFLKFHVAHDESAKKADRVRKGKAVARDRARAEGRTISKTTQPWIIIDGDTRTVNEDRAKIVRLIFRMADEGIGGRTKIVRELHRLGIAPFEGQRASEGWHESFISRLLRNRAVLGECQPHTFVDGKRVPDGEPIIGYFPAIVDPALFARVNVHASARKTMMGGRKSGKIANLVSGLIRCRHCGGTMRYREKRPAGAWKTIGGKRYRMEHADASLICTNGERGNGCTNRANIAYFSLEKALLDSCLHLAMDDEAFSNRGEVGRLGTVIAERRRTLELATERAERLWSGWADGGSDMAKRMAQDAEADATMIRVNLSALERQREQAKGRADNQEHLRRVADIRGKLYDHDMSVRIPLRTKVAEALHTLIQGIECDADGSTVRFIAGMAAIKITRKGQIADTIDMVSYWREGLLDAVREIGRDMPEARELVAYLKRRGEATSEGDLFKREGLLA